MIHPTSEAYFWCAHVISYPIRIWSLTYHYVHFVWWWWFISSIWTSVEEWATYCKQMDLQRGERKGEQIMNLKQIKHMLLWLPAQFKWQWSNLLTIVSSHSQSHENKNLMKNRWVWQSATRQTTGDNTKSDVSYLLQFPRRMHRELGENKKKRF